MAKKTEKTGKTGDRSGLNAFKVLLAGVLAELYVILLQRYYVDGNVYQMLALDDAMPALMGAGAVIAVVGLAVTMALRKAGGWKQECGVWVLVAGVFLLFATAAAKLLYATGLTVTSILVPVIAALGILWFLYDRDCFYTLAILAAGTVSTWICRNGARNILLRGYVYGGVVVLLVLLALVAWAFQKASPKNRLGKIQLMQPHVDPLPIYVACGLSAAAVILSLFSATVGYYAMWALGIVMFIVLVYYTVKQL